MIINKSNGDLQINTIKAIESNSRQVATTVGSQIIVSNPFMFEVFDCNSFVSFPDITQNLTFQLNNREEHNDAKAISTSPGCLIGKYAISEELEGVSINPDDGKITLDTSVYLP